MPIYEYQHESEPCGLGGVFEVDHPISDDALTQCPECAGAIKRLISGAYISTPTTNTEYKNMGFTKLVKRDSGVYENVTRRGGDAKYMERGKADTIPDISKTISD